MGKTYALGTSIIAFFLLGATWDKPEETEQKWFSQPKVEWDSPRKAFEAEKQYDKPPRGWYWKDNAGDFPIPKEWPEGVAERFRQLVMGERTNDLVQLRRWASETLELNTPWIDAKSDRMKDYILAKSDKYAFFTVFRLMDNAGNPKEGIVEQDFKGQAKIYGLNEEIQYKIACFDANGAVGTAVTALSDKYIRVYDYSSGTSIVKGSFIAENKNKDIYINSQYEEKIKTWKIDNSGAIAWNKSLDICQIGDPFWNEIFKSHALEITKKDRGIWVHDDSIKDCVFGDKVMTVDKINMSTGDVIWSITYDTNNSIYNYRISNFEDAILISLGTENKMFLYSDSGVSQAWKINNNSSAKTSPEHAYGTYLTINYHVYDKQNNQIAIAGYDGYGFNILDHRSGVTIASSTNYGSPRFAFEVNNNSWGSNGTDEYVGYDWGSSNKKTIDRLSYNWQLNGPSPAGAERLLIEGSNDLLAWTTLLTIPAEAGTNQYSGSSVFANTTPYRAYRGYYRDCVSSDPSYPGARINLLVFGEGSSGSPGPIIYAINSDEDAYQNLRGRIRWKADFNFKGTFNDICIGRDKSYTAVGANVGNTNIIIGNCKPSGVTEWEKSYAVGTHASSIYPTEEGGYIIAGSNGNPDTSFDSPTAFILKIDKRGNQEFVKYFNPSEDEGTFFTRCVQTIDHGYLAVGGHRLSATASQVYIVKTNRHGESCSPGVPCE